MTLSRRGGDAASAMTSGDSAAGPPPAMGAARAKSAVSVGEECAAAEDALVEVDRAPSGCSGGASCRDAARPVSSIGDAARASPPPRRCGGVVRSGASSRAACGPPRVGGRHGAFRSISLCLLKASSSFTVAGLDASPSACAQGVATGDAAESP